MNNDEMQDFFVLKLWNQAQLTATTLLNSSLESGNNYLSKELLPIIRPLMFKKLLIDEGELQADEDDDWSAEHFMITFDSMVRSGELDELINHPYYKVFSEAVDNYIDETRYYMDEGNQILVLLKQFTEELTGFMQVINENADESMVKALEQFWHSITGKVETLTQIASVLN